MRYSIMLQLVSFLTLILVGTAAFFASIQSRPAADENGNFREQVMKS